MLVWNCCDSFLFCSADLVICLSFLNRSSLVFFVKLISAEFLLTRGPYAYLGYSWCGCTDGAQTRPRAREWDESDVGEPVGGAACAEVGDSGVFKREWTHATVFWNCSTGHGQIDRKSTRYARS